MLRRPAVPAVAEPVALAAIVAAGWFAIPLVADPKTGRPAVAFAGILLSAVAMGLAARHTTGRERRGWILATVSVLGVMLPVAGSLAGILMGLGILVIAGGGWLADRHRLLDGAVALLIVCTGAVAYLFPDVATLPGVRRTDGYITAVQIVLAFSCVVAMSYRTRPTVRPDVCLVASGFVLGTITGMGGLLDHSFNHASAWVPALWWEIGLPLGAVLVTAGARVRTRNPVRELDGTGSLTRPNHGLLGQVLLGGLVLAFVLEPPGLHALTLPLLGATLLLRHLRSRLIERDNARLLAAAQAEGEHRAALYRSTLVALATAIEARDGYTGRHSDETVELAARVSMQLGLSPADVAEIKTVALLHDVGKIGVPDDVLHEPGPLDDLQWTVMRRHPEIGERILRAVPGLERVAAAVRHEHERWDGSGYPDGLAGRRIPMASRIVLVCDAYHAMTSDRPYRDRMACEDAVAELRRHAGTQFDPQVVEALLRAVRADTVPEPWVSPMSGAALPLS